VTLLFSFFVCLIKFFLLCFVLNVCSHKNKAKGKMKVGHVFTVEPMINLGVSKDCTWDDRWTAVTIDGKRSAQFEHTVVVTENGLEVMTARDDLGGGERPVTVMPEWNEVTFQR